MGGAQSEKWDEGRTLVTAEGVFHLWLVKGQRYIDNVAEYSRGRYVLNPSPFLLNFFPCCVDE